MRGGKLKLLRESEHLGIFGLLGIFQVRCQLELDRQQLGVQVPLRDYLGHCFLQTLLGRYRTLSFDQGIPDHRAEQVIDLGDITYKDRFWIDVAGDDRSQD